MDKKGIVVVFMLIAVCGWVSGSLFFSKDNLFPKPLPDDQNSYAWVLLKSNSVDQSIIEFEKELENNEKNFNFWVGLGNAYYQKQDYEKAKLAFNGALELRDSDHTPYAGLAWIAYEQKDYGNAEILFREALRRGAKDLSVHGGVARAQFHLMNYENARLSFAEASALGSPTGSAGLFLVEYAKGNREEAQKNLENMWQDISYFDILPDRRFVEFSQCATINRGKNISQIAACGELI